MAFGTLAFDTLQTSDSKNTGTSKTLDTSYVYNGSAKAFVWTASGASNTTNFNISSTTDGGTGNYSAALSSVLDATTYPAVMGTHAVTDAERNVQTGTNNTTNTIAMSAMVGSTLTDFVVNSAVFGGLA